MKLRTASFATAAITGIGGVAAVLGVGTASASVSASSYHSVHTIVLTGRYADGSNHFVGKDENNPVIGDEFLDAGPLRLNGKIVAQYTDVCQIVSGTSEATLVTQCAGAVTFAKGQLTTFGADNSSDDTTDAITGGTGAFAYAAGTAESSSGTDAVTITLRYIQTNS